MTNAKATRGWFSELQRRRVMRVALIYLGVAWTLLQVADLAFPRLGFPDWTVTALLWGFAGGFPIAMVLAWVFQVVPDSVARDADLDDETARTYRSIAVLPFDDMSEGRDQAWFAEGMAEELLNALTQIKALRVMARTSSFAFRGSGKTVAEIADALNVEAVLEGSVRRAGNTVRIVAQLIDARRGHHLWSGTFEREIEDIFVLQDKLARGIVDALRVELGVAAAHPIVVGSDVRPEAYSAFLRGRAAFDWSNPTRLHEAIDCFQHAVDVDPNYALAWGYLAHATMITPALGHDDAQALATADRAVTRALALDPRLGVALAVSAMIVQLRDHDWVRAGGLYRQALAAADNASAAALYSVLFLPQLGRFDEAFALYREIELRDPLHAGIKTNHGVTLRFAGRSDEAIDKFEEAIAISPDHVFAWSNLILAHLGRGDVAAAEAVLPRIPEALREIPNIRQRVGQVHARRGDPRAVAILDSLLAQTQHLRGRLGLVAALACDLGRDELCLTLLEQAAESFAWTKLFAFEAIPKDSPLQRHPRFQAALRSIGLDAESIATTNRALDAAEPKPASMLRAAGAARVPAAPGV
jgi:adenylate cyclase